MPLKISLSSTLRNYVPSYDPFSGIELKTDRPISVKELCKAINIPLESVKFAMVDGRHVDVNHLLQGNERVALFPAVGGG